MQSQASSAILYLEPRSGVSGEMVLGALLDLDRGEAGLEAALREALASPALAGSGAPVMLAADRSCWDGLTGTRVSLAGAGEESASGPADAAGRLGRGGLSPTVTERSVTALSRLTAAQAKVQGRMPDQLTWTDIGGSGALAALVGTFVLLEAMGVEGTAVGPLPVGGTSLPGAALQTPPAATEEAVALELLRGVPIRPGADADQPTTPVGALLLAELAEPAPAPAVMTLREIGYGFGSDMPERPQGQAVLRAMLGDSSTPADAQLHGEPGEGAALVLLETTLDDLTPEALAYLQARVLDAGARDCWLAPVFMKKGRPGAVLSVLADAPSEPRLVDLVFAESSTFGIRRRRVERYELARSWVTAQVDGLAVRVKVGRRRGRVVTLSPEFEEAAAAAAALSRPLTDVMHEAVEVARKEAR